MKIQKNVISADLLIELEELFKAKNWKIDKEEELFSSVYNRFGSMLFRFSEDKQKLLIELAHRFLNISLSDFKIHFTNAINRIENLNQFSKIIILPLKNPSNSKPKSSDNLWYTLKSYTDFSYEKFANKLLFADWDSLKKTSLTSKHLVILVDDFIGSGNTAVEILNYLYENEYLKMDINVKLLAFVAQEEGIATIHKNYGDIVVVDIITKKGITDFYSDEELEINKTKMLEIEQQIKVKPQFSFGFRQSEGLFAVEYRSANNTFPVFWLEDRKKMHLAPFKR